MYGEGATKVVALKDVCLHIEDGGFVSIMGQSGSGKSTLLNIIGGLETLTEGEIILDGERLDLQDENALVKVRRDKIAYVFQQYHLIPSLTALENVLLPLVFRGKNGKPEKASALLKKVGLEKRAHHKPSELSGGEQQRVAIARALVTSPSLILADEPTGNMDKKTGDEIIALFTELNREGHTVIMVTHNPEIAAYADEIVSLQDGQVFNQVKIGKKVG
ncbi:MAG: ABC transporter ATP-binding protein [Chloroflexi bacterium RBG_13_46_9]|nr:MAG: ABC transporter ATP-binding protein [Chloroflexi bacterium RBG_13_46_9]